MNTPLLYHTITHVQIELNAITQLDFKQGLALISLGIGVTRGI
jgi:hypothetical protein